MIDPVTAGIFVGGNVLGGILGGNASKRAARDQARAANQATQMQRYMYDQTRADQEPWRQAGTGALSQLMGGLGVQAPAPVKTMSAVPAASAAPASLQSPAVTSLMDRVRADRGLRTGGPSLMDRVRADRGLIEIPAQVQTQVMPQTMSPQDSGFGDFNKDFSMADFQADPGYQFRMDEGRKAFERSAAARGSLNSGGTMKALARYGQGLASDEFQNAYNRFNADRDRRFNRLSSLAGVGQTANSQLSQAGQNFANQAGENMIGAGNARAAGQVGSANAWSNTLGNLGNMWMMNNWMGQNGGFGQGSGPTTVGRAVRY